MTARELRRRECATDPANIAWPADLPGVLQRIYAARGVGDAAAIDYRLARLLPPDTLGNLDAAIARLVQARDSAESVLIVGDYGCDGATGCAVAVRGLRQLGFTRVAFVVPHRMRHGYGLSPALVDSLETVPDLIVTVDNGIASVAGVAAAQGRGCDVIVTDHHLPGAELPRATAIINPNLPGDAFPDKALAGVGVMFYLLLALRGHLRENGRFTQDSQPDLATLLDLVAIGTVADLVPLTANNRILVAAGLRRIRAGQCVPGIRALIETARRDQATLTAGDIAFALAPRLNAAGRLRDMREGIACLLADEAGEARERAEQLAAINSKRRDMQADMVAEAERLTANVPTTSARGVALYESHWHPGIVGLVASKVKDRLHRPVVAFAPADTSGSDELRGSARSVPGFHLRDALAAVDARQPGLIQRFGGHAMAAGLTLAADRFREFARTFDAVVSERIDASLLQPVMFSDGELPAGSFTLELACRLRDGGPWGQGFEPPFFDNVFDCVDVRRIGERHRRLQLRDPRDGALVHAVMFAVDESQRFPDRLRAGYELTVNDWKGRQSPQLIVRHIETA